MSSRDMSSVPLQSSENKPGIIKTKYVAIWNEDGQRRELLIMAGEFASHDDDGIEILVCDKARGVGWLLAGEALMFVRREDLLSVTDIESKCIYIHFAFCPASDPKQRRRNAQQRSPDWIEVDRNRLLTYLGVATFIAVIIQLALLIQQNAQFDAVVAQFDRIVQDYQWQVNTPVLGAAYQPGTDQVELTNYGQTPIRITKAVIVTYRGESAMSGMDARPLKAGESAQLGLENLAIEGKDIADGVTLEVTYIYLGNAYHMTWKSMIRFRDNLLHVEPEGEPSFEPVQH